MGSLALSRAEVMDQPAPSIAGEVARIAREQLAPLAAGIDDGTVYPAEVLRKFGAVGAWGSHVPHEGPADLRCAIQAMAAIGKSAAPRPSWPGARTPWSGTRRTRPT